MHNTVVDFPSMHDGRDHRAFPLPCYVADDVTTTSTNTNELTDVSDEDIMQFGLGFWGSKALLSAVELELFTELASAPLDEETLRQRLRLHPRGARDFFDALVALGFLERLNGVYHNTPAADLYLDRNKLSYIGGWLHLANTQLYPTWVSLTEALRTGKPQNGGKDGEDLFDSVYSDPASLANYARAMTGHSLPAARALAHQFPWTEYRTLIDVGTAEGGLPVEIGRAHPHLTGGGFDLPPVQPVFETYVQNHGLGNRLRFYAGDFLDEPLPAADVLVMGHILHDWNLEVKRELVAKAYAALPRNGALIVYDWMIDDDRKGNAAGLLMSLNMLVRTQGGFDYTGADCIGWMHATGFAEVRRARLSGPHSMVVGIK
jgi:O-methyltransferase domain/Dimerisation domain